MAYKKRTSKAAVAKRRAQADELHQSLTKQVEALADSDQWAAFLRMTTNLHNYSLNNLLLILTQRPSATAVAGFRAWQERGRQVRKGEVGIKIRGYSTKKVVVENEEGGEDAVLRKAWFPTLTVFDVSQTDPIDPEADGSALFQPLTGTDDAGLYALGAAWLADRGVALEREQLEGGRYGYTSPSTTGGLASRVVVRDGVSPEQAAKTLLHEIAHIELGHLDNLAEYAEHRGVMECEAESVAFVLAGMAGLDVSGYSVAYVTSWTGGDVDAVRETAQRVLTAAHKLAGDLWPSASNNETEGVSK